MTIIKILANLVLGSIVGVCWLIRHITHSICELMSAIENALSNFMTKLSRAGSTKKKGTYEAPTE